MNIKRTVNGLMATLGLCIFTTVTTTTAKTPINLKEITPPDLTPPDLTLPELTFHAARAGTPMGSPSPWGGTTTNGTNAAESYPYVPPWNPTYPTNATLLWETNVDYESVATPSVAPDGTVFIVSYGEILALNPDGSTRWGTNSENDNVASSAVGSDGTLYVCCANPGDGLAAFNETNGTLNWILQVAEGWWQDQSEAPVIGTNGTVYFGWNTYLYAVTNGVVEWTNNTAGSPDNTPAIGPDGTIYMPAGSYELIAVNPDGTTKWTTNIFAEDYCTPAIGTDGTIYQVNTYGNLLAVNPNGTVRWTNVCASGYQYCGSPEIGPDGTLYVELLQNDTGGDYVINALCAISSNGSLKWTFSLWGIRRMVL